MTDYRTLAIVDALTAVGVALEDWQVDALDRMILEQDPDDEA